MSWFAIEALGERLDQAGRDDHRGTHQRQSLKRARRARRQFPQCEGLEERRLLSGGGSSGPGYDYVLYGTSWTKPAHITYSIAPDGVFWEHGTNNLNAVFNARFGTSGSWQRQIALALATWQSVANINIASVADGPYAMNTLGLAQGDSRFGDIRIGGYSFLNTSTTLAQTVFPPPNGSTAAGDVSVNTALNFNIGSTYDLFSVLLHETGHSLGLNEAPNTAEVMYPNYGGIRTGLQAGDIAGIQALYGARSLDAYQASGQGMTLASAINVTPSLTASNLAFIGSVSLSQIGSAEYFTFVAPSYASGTLQVTAGASGISMLSPKVTLYDAQGHVLAQASNPSAWSNNVTASNSTLVPGQRYYVAVTGATSDVFGVGGYQLMVSMPQSTPPGQPATTPPVTTTPTPPTGTSVPGLPSNTSLQTSTYLGAITQTTITGLTLSSASLSRYYTFQNAMRGAYQVTAMGVSIQVLNARGRVIARGVNQVNLTAARAGTTYRLRLTSATGTAVSSFSLTVGLRTNSAAYRLVRPWMLRAGLR